MKNTGIILKIGIPVLLIAVIFYLYFSNQSRHNWIENYKYGSKEPYGCYVISEMLRSQDNASFSLLERSGTSTLPALNTTGNTYIFIGENLFLSDAEQDSLLRFAAKGNHVFISSKQVPSEILNTLFNESGCNYEDVYAEYAENIKETETFNFYDSSLHTKNGFQYTYRYRNEEVEYNWQVIDGSYFCDSSKTISLISYAGDNYVNCFISDYGDGSITIHTNPVMFTNLMMKEASHFDYADRLFSYIPLRSIIWDETSKFPYSEKSDPAYSTPLKYILSQPALKAGWYTLLILAALYILFRAKRRVKVIPVIEPKTNNALSFLRSVSMLFQHSNDHKKMAEMKMKFFLAFLRDRYNYTADTLQRPDFYESLSARAGVDKSLVTTIFSEYKSISTMKDIPSFRLEDFNKLIHIFYVRCS